MRAATVLNTLTLRSCVSILRVQRAVVQSPGHEPWFSSLSLLGVSTGAFHRTELEYALRSIRTTAHASKLVTLVSMAAGTLPILQIRVASLSEGLNEADSVSKTSDLSHPQPPTLVSADQWQSSEQLYPGRIGQEHSSGMA